MRQINKIIAVIGLAVLFSLFFGYNVLAQGTGAGSTAAPVVCNLSALKDDQGNTVVNKSWFLPDCVYFEGHSEPLPGSSVPAQMACGCRNVNVLIQLLINVANKILMVVGAVALLVFIYGGFLMLTSAGGEQVKKGKEALVSAVIGLVIIFSAQLLLNFVLSVVIKAGGQPGVTVQGVQVNVPAPAK